MRRVPLSSRLAAYAGLAFLHFPVAIIVLYAFTTEDRTYQFPPPGLTLKWFHLAFERSDMWAAMRLSLGVASVATLACGEVSPWTNDAPWFAPGNVTKYFGGPSRR